ncbi:class I SAM-dependent methyltransferase [Methanorbis rubei]|uniref:C-methyltransferase domain-containing protein n=1 Tax=Methanorbis rubei TaxID=3028300 RepID=A0AAE4SBL3_9EURY|nr:hypothetical protein [Methanocorpusculaceae archaeon Cs1]
MVCPICSSGQITPLYSAMNVPAFQNKAYPTEQIAESVICGNVSLYFCENCGFVWNATFDPSLLEYDEHYQNEQGYSPMFQSHLQNVCDILIPHLSQESHIVEIGCGKATFLMKLGELGYTVHGYDPAYEGMDPRIIKEYYSHDTVAQQPFDKADLIVLRHVLEHISHPLQFLQSIAEANDYQGLLYIEVPDFRWIVEKNAFYDVFFEHCNYFSLPALTGLFSDVLRTGTFFGDQYCYVIAKLEDLRSPDTSSHHLSSPPVLQFSECVSAWKSLVSSGYFVIWGAGAKGATFLREIDPERQTISAVVDINPKKQGRYMPKTAHPIISPQKLHHMQISGIIVMNDNYLDEISLSVQEICGKIPMYVLGRRPMPV